MNKYPDNIDEIKEKVKSGAISAGEGAQFWAYISPSNNTAACLTSWSVQISQQGGNWSGTITSDNPQEILQTPGLSGVFNVKVTAAGRNFPRQQITNLPDSQPDVGCNSNCFAMVGIVANQDCTGANYWTVWDAICN